MIWQDKRNQKRIDERAAITALITITYARYSYATIQNIDDFYVHMEHVRGVVCVEGVQYMRICIYVYNHQPRAFWVIRYLARADYKAADAQDRFFCVLIESIWKYLRSAQRAAAAPSLSKLSKSNRLFCYYFILYSRNVCVVNLRN